MVRSSSSKKTAAADLADLSLIHLDKIFVTVLDLEEELQIRPVPPVKIPMDLSRATSRILETENTGSFRSDALDYLKSIGAIRDFKVHTMSEFGLPGFVMVDLIRRDFEPFIDRVKEAYSERAGVEKAGTDGVSSGNFSTNPQTGASIIGDDQVIYELRMSGKTILLNNMVLSQPRFNGENERVFDYLLKHPNRTVSLDEISKALKDPLRKSLHKIVENLGFRSDILKMFIKVGSHEIYLRNPVTAGDLKALNMPFLSFYGPSKV